LRFSIYDMTEPVTATASLKVKFETVTFETTVTRPSESISRI